MRFAYALHMRRQNLVLLSFSGKYRPQPTQTELVWRMPWGCWLEYNDDQMLSEARNAATEEFSEDWPSTTVHQIQGARITLSVSYNHKDWVAMQEWISFRSS